MSETRADLLVRDFVPADEARCVEIFDRAWARAFPHRPRLIDAATFRRETTGETVLVACDRRDRVIGFSGLYAPECFIHHLYVDPACHRRGAGAALLAATLERAGGDASLKCQLSNGPALAFYRRQGWIEVEEGGADGSRWVRFASPEAGSGRPA